MENNTVCSPLVADYEKLAATVLGVVASASCDPLAKPFAVLGAAAQVCHAAAETSEEMRRRLAMAAIVLVRELAPELVADAVVPSSRAH